MCHLHLLILGLSLAYAASLPAYGSNQDTSKLSKNKRLMNLLRRVLDKTDGPYKKQAQGAYPSQTQTQEGYQSQTQDTQGDYYQSQMGAEGDYYQSQDSTTQAQTEDYEPDGPEEEGVPPQVEGGGTKTKNKTAELFKLEHALLALSLVQACDMYAVGFDRFIPPFCHWVWSWFPEGIGKEYEAEAEEEITEQEITEEMLNDFMPWGMCHLEYLLNGVRNFVRWDNWKHVEISPQLHGDGIDKFEHGMEYTCNLPEDEITGYFKKRMTNS